MIAKKENYFISVVGTLFVLLVFCVVQHVSAEPIKSQQLYVDYENCNFYFNDSFINLSHYKGTLINIPYSESSDYMTYFVLCGKNYTSSYSNQLEVDGTSYRLWINYDELIENGPHLYISYANVEKSYRNQQSTSIKGEFYMETPYIQKQNYFDFKLENQMVPSYSPSTLKFKSDFAKTLTTTPSSLSIQLINPKNNVFSRTCTNVIIDSVNGYFSCNVNPNGREPYTDTYMAIITVDSNISYSPFLFSLRSETSYPFIDYDINKCIFKNENYVFDLSKYYESNPLSFVLADDKTNATFKVCGDSKFNCSESSGGYYACKGDEMFTNRSPYLVIDEQGVVMIQFLYSKQGGTMKVNFKVGHSDPYINGNIIYVGLDSEFLYKVFGVTFDGLVSRSTQSTITIKSDFIKSLDISLNPTATVQIFEKSSGTYVNDCAQVSIKADQGIITCLSQPSGNESLFLLYTLQVKIKMGNNRYIGNHEFYYQPKVCPSSCGNGTCDQAKGICICNQGYASYDCSLKLKSLQQPKYPSIIPSLDQLNTGYQSPTESDLVYTIEFNSFGNSNSFGYIVSSTTLRSIPFVQTKYSENSASFSSSSFTYDVTFAPSVSPNGSSNSIIAYENRIHVPLFNNNGASMSKILLSNKQGSLSLSTNVEAIFEISNSKLNPMNTSISQSKDSIVIQDDSTKSALLFSISPIYSLNTQISQSLAIVRVISAKDASELKDYKSTSTYVSILVPNNFDQQNGNIVLFATFNSLTFDVTPIDIDSGESSSSINNESSSSINNAPSSSYLITSPLFTFIITVALLLLSSSF